MQSILFISGTRPEIIKLAPLYHALQQARGQTFNGCIQDSTPKWLHKYWLALTFHPISS
jgi:hypothetical protein